MSSPARARGGLRLVVTSEPADQFYKDEGGRSHALEVTVSLVNNTGNPLPDVPAHLPFLPLRCRLHYESGAAVEPAEQHILRVLAPRGDAFTIDFDSLRVHMRFRIEKVSRRAEGRRFQLYVEPDRERCVSEFASIRGVFTQPVTVLSKRKSAAARAARERERQRQRGNSMDVDGAVVDLMTRFGNAVDAVHRQAADIHKLAQAQEQRLQALEQLASTMTAPVAAAAWGAATATASTPRQLAGPTSFAAPAARGFAGGSGGGSSWAGVKQQSTPWMSPSWGPTDPMLAPPPLEQAAAPTQHLFGAPQQAHGFAQAASAPQQLQPLRMPSSCSVESMDTDLSDSLSIGPDFPSPSLPMRVRSTDLDFDFGLPSEIAA